MQRKPSRFLDALQGIHRGPPPVWFMRQAGRYLPEYRALREKHSLHELFFTPALAAEVALMPLRRLSLDAAIVFSDITAIAPAMGYFLAFQEGPIISPYAEPLHWRRNLENLALLEPIAEAALLTKQKTTLPLIGFCGGPFTIATYLIEQHNGVHFAKTRDWMRKDPQDFEAFLHHICQFCIRSLQLQIDAGADAVQIFDSWAGILETQEFALYSYPFLQKIAESVHRPTIVFMRGSALRAEQLAKIPGVAISLDMGRRVSDVRRCVRAVLQGNLDPEVLFRPIEEVREATRSILRSMHGDPGFIFNLGHGIKPGTPISAVEAVLEEVFAD